LLTPFLLSFSSAFFFFPSSFFPKLKVLVRTSDIQKEINKMNNGNRTVEVTLPLSSHLLVGITDEKKENLVTVRKGSSGTITLQVTLPLPAYTMCGYLWKVSESLLSGMSVFLFVTF
jgi:hypothetical protein